MQIQTNSGCLASWVLLLYLLVLSWLLTCLCHWSMAEGTHAFVGFFKALVEFLAWALHAFVHAIKTA